MFVENTVVLTVFSFLPHSPHIGYTVKTATRGQIPSWQSESRCGIVFSVQQNCVNWEQTQQQTHKCWQITKKLVQFTVRQSTLLVKSIICCSLLMVDLSKYSSVIPTPSSDMTWMQHQCVATVPTAPANWIHVFKMRTFFTAYLVNEES